MLFEDTVLEPQTLHLLRSLGGLLCGGKRDFSLVGGTALAIQVGHRRSIDLDFFCPGPFDTDEMIAVLSEARELGELEVLAVASNTLNLNISRVMVDLIRYAYDRLEPLVEAGGYTMLSLPDIAAMKLSAVANRGSKKDFFDIAELLKRYQLTEMLEFYRSKFKNRDTFHVLRSLSYFDDAEDEPDPIILGAQTWPGVKERIGAAVKSGA